MAALIERLRHSAGFRLSHLGERLSVHALIYNRFIMEEFHRHAVREAPKVVSAMRATFPLATRVLDVGSGSGAFAAEFQRLGVEALGLEHSSYGRRLASRQGVNCQAFDLRQTEPASIKGDFDLIYCFEVAEHLPPALGQTLVNFLCSFKRPVVFTAAHPGQGGVGHINEQPKDYWLKVFDHHGYALAEDITRSIETKLIENDAAFWFPSNILVLAENLSGVSALR